MSVLGISNACLRLYTSVIDPLIIFLIPLYLHSFPTCHTTQLTLILPRHFSQQHLIFRFHPYGLYLNTEKSHYTHQNQSHAHKKAACKQLQATFISVNAFRCIQISSSLNFLTHATNTEPTIGFGIEVLNLL